MEKLYKNEFVLDLIATIMFFTRIPVKWSYFSKTPPNLTKAAWAFPLVGFFIGVLSGLVGDLFIYLGIPIFLSVVIATTPASSFAPSTTSGLSVMNCFR